MRHLASTMLVVAAAVFLIMGVHGAALPHTLAARKVVTLKELQCVERSLFPWVQTSKVYLLRCIHGKQQNDSYI